MSSLLPPKPALVLSVEESLWVHYTDDDDTPHHPREQTSHVGSVFRCSSELGELIHETLYLLLRPSRPPTGREVLRTYTKYLSWYETLPEFFRLGHNSTPAVLFSHMYYQFATLLLFRPFMAYSISGSSLSPRDICFEAANAISALLQSYGQLYTLRRTPCFVPLFILTSSVLHLSIPPTLSLPLSLSQSQQLLASQVTEAIRQTITDLATIAPCHRSAKRAHYLISVLAKKDKLIVNAQTSLDIQGGLSLGGAGRVDIASAVLEEELAAKWDNNAGRFIGISQRYEATVQDLQNPPFWLIRRQARERWPPGAGLEAAGFVVRS